MTLCDAGPLVALIDRSDRDHRACTEALPALRGPLITTWPCLTEAMYLLGAWAGHPAQESLWNLVDRGVVSLHYPVEAERFRMRELMAAYRDTPMDFADDSLCSAAEVLDLTTVFTTDRHFHAYRVARNRAFAVLP